MTDRTHIGTMTGKWIVNGLDIVIELETENKACYLTCFPGIDKKVAAKFNVADEWDALADFCRNFQTKMFPDIARAQAYAKTIVYN